MDDDDDEGIAIDIENEIRDERFTSQAIDLEKNTIQIGLQQNNMNNNGNDRLMNTDEDSNMSQIARDFFMQTHGDKGGSFDLL